MASHPNVKSSHPGSAQASCASLRSARRRRTHFCERPARSPRRLTEAISDPRGRDYAARDFKRHLKVDLGWKPASVNLALAAIDHFNRFPVPWFGPANVRREPLSQAVPLALSMDEQRALLRGAELARPRDRAIVTLLLYIYTALRLHELARSTRGRGDLGTQGACGGPLRERGRVPGGAAQPAMPRHAARVVKARGERAGDGERVLFRRHARPPLDASVGRPGCSGRGVARRVGNLGAPAAAHVRDEPRARRQRHRDGR